MINRCTKILKRKKIEHMNKMFENFKSVNYSKSLYRTAKNLLGWSSSGQPTSLIWEGSIVRKPREITNVMQSFFKNKIQKLMSELKKVAVTPVNFWSEPCQGGRGGKLSLYLKLKILV